MLAQVEVSEDGEEEYYEPVLSKKVSHSRNLDNNAPPDIDILETIVEEVRLPPTLLYFRLSLF